MMTYLETSGTDPEALKKVIRDTDVVAMDVKLPSAIGRAFWTEHMKFLKIAGGRAFVKIILTDDVPEEEMARAIALLAAARPVPPLVLQPVTAVPGIRPGAGSRRANGFPKARRVSPPSPERVEAWREFASRRLPDVRVLSQMHPLWGVR
jgi:hypothetical protein